MRANFGCERTKDVAAYREHTHRQFELYLLDIIIIAASNAGAAAKACKDFRHADRLEQLVVYFIHLLRKLSLNTIQSQDPPL